MKRFFTAVLFLAGCATASAQTLLDQKSLLGTEGRVLNISLDSRFDLRYTDGRAGNEYSNFEAKLLRVLVTGEVTPGIRYAVRQLLNKPSNPLADGSGSGTNYAWVAFDLGRQKAWTITVGKQTAMMGTYEFGYNAGDLYLATQVSSDFDFYHVGVNTAYRFAGQTLNLQVMNAGNQYTFDKNQTRGLGAAFLWQGSLFKDVLGTKIGYSAWQHHGSQFYSWVTAGLQLNTGVLTTELDLYHGDRYLDYSAILAERAGKHRVRDLSLAANFKLNLGKWRPSVKGVWDRRNDRELKDDVFGNMGIQAALEFYPFKETLLKGLRFHAVYTYKHTEFDGQFSGLDSKWTHTALVGMRWLLPVK